MLKGSKSIKLNNKSSNVVQVNNGMLTSLNTGSYVNIGMPTHTQYNNDVSMLNYLKSTKYQKYTMNNPMLFKATDETLVKSTFETIGEEPIIGHCITTQDLINIYANGCIQEFYEEYCKLHSHKENLILGKVLSILGIEIWKNITCYGGIYSGSYMVSNLGRVLRLYKTRQAKIVKPLDNGNGYLYVKLSHNNKKQNVYVHRLVGLNFIEEPTEPLECCHSNTNRYDNRLFNLDLKTHSENIQNPITQRKFKETLKVKAESASASTTSAPTLE